MRKLVALAIASVAGLVLVGLAIAGLNGNWSVHLNGATEVPVRDTLAQGQATFNLSEDGTSIEYKLTVANIENVLQAHIHLGPPTGTGGIVVWLYPPGPPPVLIPGRSDGTLAEGSFTAADLVGALAGHPLEDLIAALESGNAYVNVHTVQFPGGEIRGNF
jgi:hypothetical protein